MPLRQRFACPHKDCKRSYCQQGKQNFQVKTALGMTGNTPKCSYCEKMFATQAGKLRHEANVHLGKKTIPVTDVCQKTYGHLRFSHKTDRFQCLTCDKTCAYAHILEEQRGKCVKPIAKCSICIIIYVKSMAIHTFGNLLISSTNVLLIATFTFNQINNIL